MSENGLPDRSFWFVYGDGQNAPTVRHGSFEHAEREAARLARAVPGVTFFVLRVEVAIRKSDIVVRKFPIGVGGGASVEDPDMPF